MRYLISSILTLLFSGCGVSVYEMGTNFSYAKEQLDQGTDIHATYDDGETVLFWAAGEGSIPLVEFYLSKGADINALNIWKSTPLHWAVNANKLEMVKYLISHGADITAKDAAGDTALGLAKAQDFKNMIDYLDLLYKVEYPAFDKAKNEKTLNAYKTFIKTYPQSTFAPFIEKLIEQRTKALFSNPIEMKRIADTLTAFIHKRNIKGFMSYTREDQKAFIYAQNDDKFSLLFIGPKALTVGKVLQYKEEGFGELVLAAKIKGQKMSYKDFSFDEIKVLKQMGLTDVLLAAMLEVTTQQR